MIDKLPPLDDWLEPAPNPVAPLPVMGGVDSALESLPKPRDGRHHVPTDFTHKAVQEAAGIGYLTEAQIAKIMQISVATLHKYYAAELADGAALKTLAVAKNVWRIATSGEDKIAANVGMWWLERRGGDIWKRPNERIEVSVRENPPVIDSSKLTFEQRQQLKAIILAATAVEAKQLEQQPSGAIDGPTE